MARIHYMNGPDSELNLDVPYGGKDITSLSEGELALWEALDRLHTEQEAVYKKNPLSTKGDYYERPIAVIEDALMAHDDYNKGLIDYDDLQLELELIEEDSISGIYSIEGIGRLKSGKKKRIAKKKKRTNRRYTRKTKMKQIKKSGAKGKAKRSAKKEVRDKYGSKTGKFIRKTGKSVGKGALKVATAPARAAANLITKTLLPKTAEFFVYMFLTPQQLAKAPASVKAKEKKQRKVAKDIMKITGMKESVFKSRVKKGITKKHKMSPERYLAKMMNSSVSGIGVPPALIMSLVELVKTIAKVFKRKPDKVDESDIPVSEDWEGMNEAEKKTISNQVAKSARPLGPVDDSSSLDDDFSDGGSIWNTLKF